MFEHFPDVCILLQVSFVASGPFGNIPININALKLTPTGSSNESADTVRMLSPMVEMAQILA